MISETSDRHSWNQNFRLQFITNGDSIESTVNGTEAALRGGCRWIQLRMKESSREEISEAGRRIRRLCDSHDAIFIIDDHAELVETTDADGVHLGKNDIPPEDARKIIGDRKIIGSTANSPDDIRQAVSSGADYIGLGPFRFTSTKRNLSPILGIDGYKSILSLCRREGIRIPVVAIGGITRDDILPLLSTGVAGIAVSGAIRNAASPEKETAAWLSSISGFLDITNRPANI